MAKLRWPNLSVVVIMAIVFFVIGVIYYLNSSPDKEKWWVIVLLGFPLFPMLFAKFGLPNSRLRIMWEWVVAISTLLTTLSLIVYSNLSKVEYGYKLQKVDQWHGVLFWLNLVVTIALAVIAFVIVALVLRPRSDNVGRLMQHVLDRISILGERLAHLQTQQGSSASDADNSAEKSEETNPPITDSDKNGEEQVHPIISDIRSQPLSALCFFLLIFIYITYHLAFALALNDRGERVAGVMPALTAQGLHLHLPMLTKEEIDICRAKEGLLVVRDIRFVSNSVHVDYNHNLFLDLAGQHVQECDSLPSAREQNACALHSIVQAVSCYSSKERARVAVTAQVGPDITVEHARIRIQQVEHAVESAIATRYREHMKRVTPSEAEGETPSPSQEEKDTMSSGIRTETSFPEVAWITGVFDLEEGPQSEVRNQAEDGPGISEVTVEVGPISQTLGSEWIESPKTPELLDYVYFTVYTITTTGYGDIKPMNSKAKFICTIANLYEIFFIVIFFNVFLSVSREAGVPVKLKDAG